MTDFETKMLIMIEALQKDMSEMKKDMSNMKNDISNIKDEITDIKDEITDMKESLEITRAAANYNGEKLDDLVEELKSLKVIA